MIALRSEQKTVVAGWGEFAGCGRFTGPVGGTPFFRCPGRSWGHGPFTDVVWSDLPFGYVCSWAPCALILGTATNTGGA